MRPGSNTYSGGTYLYSLANLVGTRPTFVESSMELAAPLDAARLYMVEEGALEGLELVPLLRFMESPRKEANACYFYSRMCAGNRVRWVSYHFEGGPEGGSDRIEAGDDVVAFVHELEQARRRASDANGP